MERRNIKFSASQNGVYVDLIAVEKDTAAAEKYFNKLDESAKSQATYRKLLRWYCREERKTRQRLFSRRWIISTFLIARHHLMIMINMYYHMKELVKKKEISNEIEQMNINREYLWEECWLYGDDDEDEDAESQVIKPHRLCSTIENLMASWSRLWTCCWLGEFS